MRKKALFWGYWIQGTLAFQVKNMPTVLLLILANQLHSYLPSGQYNVIAWDGQTNKVLIIQNISIPSTAESRTEAQMSDPVKFREW